MNKDKIRVLHLSSEKTWRGGEQQIAYLIGESEKLGIESLVAVRKGSAFEKYCRLKNIDAIPLSFSGSVDIKSALAVKSICKEFHIDLVHMHSSKSHGIGVLSATLGNDVPLILSRRVDFVPKDSFFTKWKYSHHSIKKIICVSHKINEIMDAYTGKPEKCLTVHDGIDLSKFAIKPAENKLRKEFGIPASNHIVGNTSALAGHKDYFTFINTIRNIVQKKIPVTAFIIGEGPLEKELKEYVVSQNLTDTIIFTGFRKDISDVLPSLDLFLMTSREEGLGTSVLDAFVAGVPVVATNAGGIPEMVIHQETGLLANVGDHETLALHVMQVLTDESHKMQLTQRASEKVKEFSKEVMATKTVKVYRETLKTV